MPPTCVKTVYRLINYSFLFMFQIPLYLRAKSFFSDITNVPSRFLSESAIHIEAKSHESSLKLYFSL